MPIEDCMALGKSNEFQKIREDDRKAWAILEKERPTARIQSDFVGDGSIPKSDGGVSSSLVARAQARGH